MSIVHKPNLNFDNETKTHIPYSEIVRGQLKSSYEKFREPKLIQTKKKKVKREVAIEKDPRSFNKWFK
jgi:hypothetical protein